MDQSLLQSPLVETYDEFDEAAEMPHSFCRQLTHGEIEEQSETATQRGLDDLINYLEKNPEEYAKIIRKRKVEDLENGGIFSYLKVKMLSVLHGDQYSQCLVTEDETCNQLNELKRGMTRAFNYSQDSKGRRFSSRLAQKRKLNESRISDENQSPRRYRESTSHLHRRTVSKISNDGSPNFIPVAKVAPNDALTVPTAPPPPPLLPLTPRLQLQRQPLHKKSVSQVEGAVDYKFLTPQHRTKKHKRTVSNGSNTSVTSVTSLTSIHSELMSSNPLTRLRSTDLTRSPGGTPVRPRSENFTPAGSLHKALITIMKRKFRNIRTPSPRSANQSRNSSQNNSESFSPGVYVSP